MLYSFIEGINNKPPLIVDMDRVTLSLLSDEGVWIDSPLTGVSISFSTDADKSSGMRSM